MAAIEGSDVSGGPVKSKIPGALLDSVMLRRPHDDEIPPRTPAQKHRGRRAPAALGAIWSRRTSKRGRPVPMGL
jgi:hypothetical protein